MFFVYEVKRYIKPMECAEVPPPPPEKPLDSGRREEIEEDPIIFDESESPHLQMVAK